MFRVKIERVKGRLKATVDGDEHKIKSVLIIEDIGQTYLDNKSNLRAHYIIATQVQIDGNGEMIIWSQSCRERGG